MPSRPTSLVIGAASDVGAAVCRALAARGDALVLATHRRPCPVAADDLGTPVTALQADVTDASSLAALMDQALEQRAQHLVYVAGHHRLRPLTLRDNGDLAAHWAVNVQGAIDAARLFALHRQAPKGQPRSITLVASIAHRLGEAGLSAYAASKAALVAAARSMAVEFAGRGVRVNTVSPGWLEGQTADAVRARLSPEALDEILRAYPLGPGRPEDAAHAVAFLASDQARWITGIDLVVDGGRTCR